jgi:predicted secreted protein
MALARCWLAVCVAIAISVPLRAQVRPPETDADMLSLAGAVQTLRQDFQTGAEKSWSA